MKKECIAMLLAGGQGSRLYVLTGDMAKPAVPFGGKYRIIDFPLFNSRGRYWVSTPTVSIPELAQLDRGKSMMRNFPPKGTAGFAMSPVSTYSRLPCPPARSMATHSFFMSVPPFRFSVLRAAWTGP